jgi:phosphohistidine swiveling domain-containing protein
MTNSNKWFVHARRNASLQHLSYLMEGLGGKGWGPVVNFFVNDVIILGYAEKGGFIYLDENQLSSKEKFKDIQESIDNNPNFIRDFRRRTDEIFGAVIFKSLQIEEENLSVLSTNELGKLYNGYVDAIMVAPIITVQVYGIEALIDPEYKIVKTLRLKLKELGREGDFDKYKEIFLTNDGETVPFTERKDFYQACVAIKNGANKDELIDTHIKKYHWVNTEYLGGGWTREKWSNLFIENIEDKDNTPEKKLEELLNTFTVSLKQKADAIKELQLAGDVVHSINCLGEILAQRDWTKGYMAKSLTGFHKLLNEIAKRFGITFAELLNYSYHELKNYFETETPLLLNELELRKKEGYALVIKNGNYSLQSGLAAINEVMKNEMIESPVDEVEVQIEVKGLVASRGKVTGKVHVIDNAKMIPEFKDGEILVTYMTTIEFTPLFRKAIGVVTDEGGMSCHAAIVSREFKLPCVVGTRTATRMFKTGDTVELDAITGIVRKI